jgi:AP2-like factor (ANT lineage)
MALSLDNSSFYYGGGHGQHHGQGQDHVTYLHPLQGAMIPGASAHDVYAHSSLVDEQSAAAIAAGWFAARSGGCGYDANSSGMDAALVPVSACHPLALSMSSGSGSQASCVTMQMSVPADPVAEYIAVEGSKKRGTDRGAGAGQRQTVHRKSIDTFGQRTSQYRGVTRYSATPTLASSAAVDVLSSRRQWNRVPHLTRAWFSTVQKQA